MISQRLLMGVLVSWTLAYAQPDRTGLLLVNRAALDSAREAYLTGRSTPAVRSLLDDAEGEMALAPVSVAQKRELPPSGDRHDYLSLAPYWWPDSTKPDGLPYIRRDGVVNPEYRSVGDQRLLREMITNVRTLALAFAVTGEERYARRAIRQLEVWFLDDSTRMNPNLNYAQAIKGVNDGRGIGIIETYGFRYLIDAIILLRRSGAWTPAIRQGMTGWFSVYLAWLQESPNGVDEAGWKNNHGSAYDVQTATIAFYLGREDVVRRILNEVAAKRIAVQIEPDGAQPLELERTKSWDYSVMNLDALVELAILADRVGVDLWRFRTADGRGIPAALEFLLPFAVGNTQWTRTQIVPFLPERLHFALSWAADRLGDSRLARAAVALSTDSLRTSREYFYIPPAR